VRWTISYVIVIFVVVTPGCKSRTASPPQGATSGPSHVDRQDFGDFSFEVPDGWTIDAPDRSKTKATLLFGGARWDIAKGMIKVDVGGQAFPTPQATAESFAKGLNGQIAKDAIDVDGEKGAKATTSSDTLNAPRYLIVVHKNGRAYLLMAASVKGTDVSGAFEQVRKSWKWFR
jgi:predicted Zn-dependent protease